ncbi:hypothetical protein ON010_g13462 [Phytophthora cinnamomi]|nr:hypothetical protein ON010_g13462 [Phytophthora cinnamomi]
MDASDTGVCALEPQLQQFIRVEFSDAERARFSTSKTGNSINVRELMSAVLAVVHWGRSWAPTGRDRIHVCVHIDNTSAVTWLAKRSSRHPTARMYNRLISLAEFKYSLACSAQHIAGELKTMADSDSRAWNADHPLYNTWTNLSQSWTQVKIQPPSDNLWNTWEKCFAGELSQTLPVERILPTGSNGVNSRRNWAGLHSSLSPVDRAIRC